MSDAGSPAIRRRYVGVSFGQVHLAECGGATGSELPVVLLHQTPRSWDEYREVLPLLGRRFRAIAFDTPGMGDSDAAPTPTSSGSRGIETYAAGLVEAIDALGIERFDLVGHHTGGVIAVEVAASAPERIGRLVLSSTPFIDAAEREARRGRPPIDAVEVQPDGSHLRELWQRRQPFYPENRPDLLSRFVRDALVVDDPEAGHAAVGAYRMEDRLGSLAETPVLLVGHRNDPHASPHLEPLARQVPHAQIAWIEDGMVPLEFTADRFAPLVSEFLAAGHEATPG